MFTTFISSALGMTILSPPADIPIFGESVIQSIPSGSGCVPFVSTEIYFSACKHRQWRRITPRLSHNSLQAHHSPLFMTGVAEGAFQIAA